MPTSSRQPTSLVPGYRPGYCSTMTPASEAWRLLWCWNRMGWGNTTETAHRQSCLNMSSKLCVAKQCPSQCLKWGKGFLPWCRPVRVHTLAEDSQYKFFFERIWLWNHLHNIWWKGNNHPVKQIILYLSLPTNIARPLWSNNHCHPLPSNQTIIPHNPT